MQHHPISFAEYRAIDAVSNSALKHIDRSPRHMLNAQQYPMETTDAMRFGTLVDHLLFGTECQYVVSPYDDFRTKEAKEWKLEHTHAGVAIFKPDKMKEAENLAYALKHHPDVAEILKTGRSQVAVVREIEGVKVKGLFDWMPDDTLAIADLKTTEDASEDAFQRHALNMGYHAQQALYHDLWAAETDEDAHMLWIVGETGLPHEVAVYRCMDDMLELGRQLYRRRLARFREALESGIWQGYPQGIQPMHLPAWAVPKER
ncbi:MAG: PD-(D/E)XK nuclease-like domain-containing protein [Verrucomicrobiales bacterium]|nr:PD-(D/E)XK nuclease-like domain-containing protein [Verrucomicrobiales bacterium]